MSKIKDYIDELSMEIDETQTQDEALSVSQRLDEGASHIRALRYFLDNTVFKDSDLLHALDSDLEHFEGSLELLSMRSVKTAEHHSDVEEKEFGTYEQQVRSQYQAGAL